jgi:hypothetical protein
VEEERRTLFILLRAHLSQGLDGGLGEDLTLRLEKGDRGASWQRRALEAGTWDLVARPG